MRELIIAFGLFLFIEGILYALFPSKMKSMLKKLELVKDSQLRSGGLIFADAFGRDPEFFAFYRAMQAYETALIGGDTSVILSPDSEFFKFFGNIKPKSE